MNLNKKYLKYNLLKVSGLNPIQFHPASIPHEIGRTQAVELGRSASAKGPKVPTGWQGVGPDGGFQLVMKLPQMAGWLISGKIPI